MKLLLPIAVMALLAGCATARSKPACLHVPAYSQEFQARLANQLPTLPAEARQVIEDAGDLRARARAACR